MLVAYVDESHTPAYFCFAAVVADEYAIRDLTLRLDAEMDEVSRRFGLPPGVEIHGYPMFHGRDVWSVVPPRSRIWAYERIVSVILNADVRIIFRGIHTDDFLESGPFAKTITREQLCFQDMLMRLNSLSAKDDTHTLVIVDDRDDRESHRAHFSAHRKFDARAGGGNERLERLLDTIYFAPSYPSRLLQAADVLAFIIRRWQAHVELDPRSFGVMKRLHEKLTSSGKLYSSGNWHEKHNSPAMRG